MATNEGEGSSPLLRKKEHYYHPGCPGCDHDRRMDLQTGMPYKEFLYVWMICLTTGTALFCPCNLITRWEVVNDKDYWNFLLPGGHCNVVLVD
jgi:hypothetical protein